MPEEIEIQYDPLYGIPAEMVDGVWDEVWKMLDKAYQKMEVYKYYTEDDLHLAVTEKRMQLWVTIVDHKLKAAFLTIIIQYPQRKVFDIVIVGGDGMGDWVAPTWEIFKAYARSHECDGIRGFGREGWVKVLDDDIELSAIWDFDL